MFIIRKKRAARISEILRNSAFYFKLVQLSPLLTLTYTTLIPYSVHRLWIKTLLALFVINNKLLQVFIHAPCIIGFPQVSVPPFFKRSFLSLINDTFNNESTIY